jgi:hypothetical protein
MEILSDIEIEAIIKAIIKAIGEVIKLFKK